MPTLWVIVPTFDRALPVYDFGVLDAVVAELDAATLGVYIGTGGTDGHLMFGYRVAGEAAARAALDRAMARHRPQGGYQIRSTEETGCGLAFEVLEEFNPTVYSLQRADGTSLGDFGQVQSAIRRRFPGVCFAWTLSGTERVRALQVEGRPLSPELLQKMEALPSKLEGVADGDGYRVKFGLGHHEPVLLLRVTPLGRGAVLQDGLTGLQADLGGEFQISESGSAVAPGAPEEVSPVLQD